jgi:hypothetical protein
MDVSGRLHSGHFPLMEGATSYWIIPRAALDTAVKRTSSFAGNQTQVVQPIATLDTVGKRTPSLVGNQIPVVQPVASHFTD